MNIILYVFHYAEIRIPTAINIGTINGYQIYILYYLYY